MPDKPTWPYVVLHLGALIVILAAFVVLAVSHGLSDSMPEGFIALAGAIVGSASGLGSKVGALVQLANAPAPAPAATPGSLMQRGAQQ